MVCRAVLGVRVLLCCCVLPRACAVVGACSFSWSYCARVVLCRAFPREDHSALQRRAHMRKGGFSVARYGSLCLSPVYHGVEFVRVHCL